MKKKKLMVGISTLLMVSLIATGCGRKIEIKNGSKVAVSIKGDKFTATEYYEDIKKDNISALIDMIDHSILDKKYKADDKEKYSNKYDSKMFREFRNSDAATVVNLYNEELLPHFRTLLSKDIKEFKDVLFPGLLCFNEYKCSIAYSFKPNIL